jgi:hypothetical protein
VLQLLGCRGESRRNVQRPAFGDVRGSGKLVTGVGHAVHVQPHLALWRDVVVAVAHQ